MKQKLWIIPMAVALLLMGLWYDQRRTVTVVGQTQFNKLDIEKTRDLFLILKDQKISQAEALAYLNQAYLSAEILKRNGEDVLSDYHVQTNRKAVEDLVRYDRLMKIQKELGDEDYKKLFLLPSLVDIAFPAFRRKIEQRAMKDKAAGALEVAIGNAPLDSSMAQSYEKLVIEAQFRNNQWHLVEKNPPASAPNESSSSNRKLKENIVKFFIARADRNRLRDFMQNPYNLDGHWVIFNKAEFGANQIRVAVLVSKSFSFEKWLHSEGTR